MHSIALLGWFGALLSIALPWPQVWRSVVHGRTTGLSATACWQGTAMPVGWITYGLLTGENVQVVTNLVTGTAGLAVLVIVLVKQSELRSRRTLMISASGAAAVVVAAAVSAAAGQLAQIGGTRAAACLGAVLAGTAVLGAIPQPVSLLRDRGQDLAGLSPLRWWLTAAAGGTWCGYGLATAQPAVWLSALAGLVGAVVVCGVLVADRRVQAATPAPIAHATTPAPTPIASATATATAPIAHVVAGPALEVHPARVTVGRPAATLVTRPASATARRVHGPARAARPVTVRPVRGVVPVRPARGVVAARPARGVARVPRAADPATLIMSMEPAPA